MKSTPTDHSPDPQDEAALLSFIKGSAREASATPPPQILHWKTEILANARSTPVCQPLPTPLKRLLITFAPVPLRFAWAALWITAAAFHWITPEPPISAPPVRRPTAAAFQQLAKAGQNPRTLSPTVQFHSLKRELQLR
jgi:hypothetical protein